MKALLALLLAGKLGKILFSGGSMLLSIFVYSLAFGWRYSVGFVLLLLCHEMGHFIAARRRGLDVSLPTFIPFVGAWINLKSQHMEPETQAFVGLAGPILGSAAAFVLFLYADATGSELLLAIAYSGFILNLFNLVPVLPLDGGHVVGVISPKIWLVGLPLLVALYCWRPNPLLIIVAIIGLPQVWKAYKGETGMATIPDAGLKVQYAAEYLGLVAFLTLMAFDVHSRLRT